MKKEHLLKREHHYLWAKYLRNWSIDGKMSGIELRNEGKFVFKIRNANHLYHDL
jgi:hypothetical protein